ncbi:hypothetical protein HPB51_015865 [Rhipicephalus microplus]|uniref:Uncharacterized protein n=1 Tax=Rhipicephalus microplus TaxID=6941 RepID=A0A9J6DH51_RHIMP|nr:hypothetical protein HPB51_015865 [Rhipicephalus microplus]
MEDRVKRQRQKVGKAAFLQAVARGESRVSEGSSSTHESSGDTLTQDAFADSVDSELPQQKWLQQNGSPQPAEESPQSDDVDLDDSSTTIEQLSTELTVSAGRHLSHNQTAASHSEPSARSPGRAIAASASGEVLLHSDNDGGQPLSLPFICAICTSTLPHRDGATSRHSSNSRNSSCSSHINDVSGNTQWHPSCRHSSLEEGSGALL